MSEFFNDVRYKLTAFTRVEVVLSKINEMIHIKNVKYKQIGK